MPAGNLRNCAQSNLFNLRKWSQFVLYSIWQWKSKFKSKVKCTNTCNRTLYFLLWRCDSLSISLPLPLYAYANRLCTTNEMYKMNEWNSYFHWIQDIQNLPFSFTIKTLAIQSASQIMLCMQCQGIQNDVQQKQQQESSRKKNIT